MEGACYMCNQNGKSIQHNLCQLRSNHSDQKIVELIKRIINGQFPYRNLDDEANVICNECLVDILRYDLMCLEVKKQEEKLCALLLATETAICDVEIKDEPSSDLCHNESVPVNGSKEDNGSEIKTEPDFDEEMLAIFGENTSQNDPVILAPALMNTTNPVVMQVMPAQPIDIMSPLEPITKHPLQRLL